VGALIAGLVADWLGMAAAIHVVATLTLLSGIVVLLRMRETLERFR
jgi:predicted MFS family arabinose efflux permease